MTIDIHTRRPANHDVRDIILLSSWRTSQRMRNDWRLKRKTTCEPELLTREDDERPQQSVLTIASLRSFFSNFEIYFSMIKKSDTNPLDRELSQFNNKTLEDKALMTELFIRWVDKLCKQIFFCSTQFHSVLLLQSRWIFSISFCFILSSYGEFRTYSFIPCICRRRCRSHSSLKFLSSVRRYISHDQEVFYYSVNSALWVRSQSRELFKRTTGTRWAICSCDLSDIVALFSFFLEKG